MKNKKILISMIVLIVLSFFLLRPDTSFDVEVLNEELESDYVQDEKVILPVGLYSIIQTQSKIIWEGKKVTGTSHSGDIKIKNSNVVVDLDGNVSGNIIIDMKSINNTDMSGKDKSNLERHLKSPDFFDVNNFETGQITFNSVERNENKISFVGDLTVKGITNPITFDAFIKKDINEMISTKSVIVFDRAKYDVRYGSGSFFENLGDNMISDDIKLDVEILIQPKSLYSSK
tara:strand:+ start:153 stop:845 length:693 start_codon:yes stop_codon:yes gene_type:complete